MEREQWEAVTHILVYSPHHTMQTPAVMIYVTDMSINCQSTNQVTEKEVWFLLANSVYIYQNKYMALLSRATLVKRLLLLLFFAVQFQLVYCDYIKFSITNVFKREKSHD